MRRSRHFVKITLALAALLAVSSTVPAEEIVGKVVLSGEPAAGVVISIEDVRLEGLSGRPVYVMDHHDLNFVPHVLVLRAGSVVQFKNSDGMPCRIYSIGPTDIFVMRQEKGKPMTVTFNRPGVIEIRCADHSRIYAYIVVKENPYFALSDDKGGYRISGVPPGRYNLQAWYEGLVVGTQTVEVGRKKLRVDWQASKPERKTQAGGTQSANRSEADVWVSTTSVCLEEHR